MHWLKRRAHLSEKKLQVKQKKVVQMTKKRLTMAAQKCAYSIVTNYGYQSIKDLYGG
jgi:hypothetical protein|tara:strand:- start:4588 stop:4758 length:171 start_codon:yes stop_codon:yes gene_type:complete